MYACCYVHVHRYNRCFFVGLKLVTTAQSVEIKKNKFCEFLGITNNRHILLFLENKICMSSYRILFIP